MKIIALIAAAVVVLPFIPQNADAGPRRVVVHRSYYAPAYQVRQRHYSPYSCHRYDRRHYRGVSISVGRPHGYGYYRSGYCPGYYRYGAYRPRVSIGIGRYW